MHSSRSLHLGMQPLPLADVASEVVTAVALQHAHSLVSQRAPQGRVAACSEYEAMFVRLLPSRAWALHLRKRCLRMVVQGKSFQGVTSFMAKAPMLQDLIMS